jgi:RimJ/RimL family protein N-acetyltransferase
MIVEELRLEHFESLALQDAQSHFEAFMRQPEYRKAMIESGPAYAGLCAGRVIAAAGLAHQWPGRAIAWSLLAPDIGHHFIELHRAVKRALEIFTVRRIEAHVDPAFQSAVRWVEMLDFRRECTMAKFTPDGRDCDLYVRIYG